MLGLLVTSFQFYTSIEKRSMYCRWLRLCSTIAKEMSKVYSSVRGWKETWGSGREGCVKGAKRIVSRLPNLAM